MTVKYNAEKKLHEVIDRDGKVVAADKSKANADAIDRGMGLAPKATPYFDAITKGVHASLTEFGYRVTLDYIAEQVRYVLRGEHDKLAGGPGIMAKSLVAGVAEEQPDVVARATEEVR